MYAGHRNPESQGVLAAEVRVLHSRRKLDGYGWESWSASSSSRPRVVCFSGHTRSCVSANPVLDDFGRALQFLGEYRGDLWTNTCSEPISPCVFDVRRPGVIIDAQTPLAARAATGAQCQEQGTLPRDRSAGRRKAFVVGAHSACMKC